jgi:primary-amine oxidase
MVRFLEKEHRRQPTGISPVRVARVQVTVFDDTGLQRFFELFVDLDRSAVVNQQHLVGKHPYIDSAYMKSVEDACLGDPRIQIEIQKLDLPPRASVIVEPWAYATDGLNEMSQRITMVRIFPLCNVSTTPR